MRIKKQKVKKKQLKFQNYKNYLRAAKIENKKNYWRKEKFNLYSLKEDQEELINS